MPTRTRLLVSFVAIALLVLTVFGIMAYRIANESALLREAMAMQATVDEIAGQMTSALQVLPPALDTLRGLRLPYLQHARLFLVHTADGKSVPLGGLERDQFPDKGKLLAQLANTAQPASGQLLYRNLQYTWASVFIPGTDLRLTVVHPSIDVEFATLRSLGMRMLITAGIVIWIAVWGALIITALLTKHLNKQNARLVHQALHDDLTDLPNRNLLYDRIEQALHRCHREGQSLALFIMDLDRFKEVNDTLGHHFGDHVLQQVGKRISATLRETDTVARLGGDEFAVLIPDAHMQDAQSCAEKLLATLDVAIPINGMSLSVKTSIGIALYPQHGGDAESLLQHADVAMYQAKRSGSGFNIYAQDQDPHSLRRLTLIGELREAIAAGQLELHYQPKVNLKQQRTHDVEALVRWQHPTLGLILPEEFVPLAEQNGLIAGLTDWVLHTAVKQCCDWRARGICLRVAVNLSAHSLHDLNLPDYIAAILKAADLPASQITIELTESAMMSDLARAMDIFERLAAMGIRLSIDDFGTGLSSLSYLKRLPVNELKIDKSFVIDMAEDENNAVIVRSIIDLAHNIGREVVAEGVQDRDALQLVEMLGADTAQGYYISRPRSAADLETWLHDSEWGLRVQGPRGDTLHLV
ncbi:MAG: EAL domain-containing protein [Gammaproteobacteria bacterium]|nr:EAL domain-containing protein [Gammaproteobacteria bacterium]